MVTVRNFVAIKCSLNLSKKFSIEIKQIYNNNSNKNMQQESSFYELCS
jgi:hypothetical protein